MAQLVTEKDSGLRQAMRTMGLIDSSYWGSWLLFDLGFATLLTLVIVFSGGAEEFAAAWMKPPGGSCFSHCSWHVCSSGPKGPKTAACWQHMRHRTPPNPQAWRYASGSSLPMTFPYCLRCSGCSWRPSRALSTL